MIFRLIQYLIGVVQIQVAGEFPERLLNLCIAHRILLWDIRKNSNNTIYCRMRLPDFFRIRPLVRKSHTKLLVLAYYGFPFWLKRAKKRPMLVGGLILFISALYCVGEYVWFVSISSPPEISAEAVRTVAYQQGLKPGVLKSVVNRSNVEKAIILEMPEVAWAGIDFTGTRAMIEVVAKTLPGPDDKAPANIVAAKDGTITEIIVLSGQGMVSKGQTVKKGELLIVGKEPGSERSIRANGIVQARVWYESDGEAPLTETILLPTGRKRLAAEVDVNANRLFPGWISQAPYNEFTTEVIYKKNAGWRNREVAVETTIKLYYEMVSQTTIISPEAALGKARDQALTGLQELLPEDAQLLSQSAVTLPNPQPEIVKVRVKVETRENIGQFLHSTP